MPFHYFNFIKNTDNSVFDYSKVYSMYGMQAYRYVDWETNDAPYTTEQMEALAAAYAAE